MSRKVTHCAGLVPISSLINCIGMTGRIRLLSQVRKVVKVPGLFHKVRYNISTVCAVSKTFQGVTPTSQGYSVLSFGLC